MRVFISVAGPDRPKAIEAAFALRGEGHQVFLDEHSLPPGGVYHRRIREAIAQADLIVFFISPISLQADRYTLTELKFIEDRFPHPQGRVLPTMIDPVAFTSIPPYLRAVTVCEPRGDIAAEVAYEISRMAGQLEQKGETHGAVRHSGSMFANVGDLGVPPRILEGAVAGIGLAALTLVAVTMAFEFEEALGVSEVGSLALRTIPLTAMVWLAALLFHVRSPLAYAALAAGCLGAVVFDGQAFQILKKHDLLLLLYMGKSAVFAATAAIALHCFRSTTSWVCLLGAGALSSQLATKVVYNFPLADVVWDALLVGTATVFLAMNESVRMRRAAMSDVAGGLGAGRVR